MRISYLVKYKFQKKNTDSIIQHVKSKQQLILVIIFNMIYICVIHCIERYSI